MLWKCKVYSGEVLKVVPPLLVSAMISSFEIYTGDHRGNFPSLLSLRYRGIEIMRILRRFFAAIFFFHALTTYQDTDSTYLEN